MSTLGLKRRIAPYRRTVVFGVHLGMAATSNLLAFLVRFDGRIPSEFLSVALQYLPLLVVIRATMFGCFRLHQGLWRYADVGDLRDIVLGVLTSSVIFGATIWGFGVVGYPRSVFLIDVLLLVPMMAGGRLARRALAEARWGQRGRTVLAIGAGDAGEMVVRDMKKRGEYEPIGFVDDDVSKVGTSIHGVPVLGTRRDLPEIMKKRRPDDVLVAIPGAGSSVLGRDVVRALEPFTARITTLPSIGEMVSGQAVSSQIRQLSMEDLLPRPAVGLDGSSLRRLISGQRVMVTGAGGSIGSELCRQIVALRPACLVLFERYENSLYAIKNDLLEGPTACPVHACIGDITDVRRLDDVLTQYAPSIVFHAAAHKHVPLMEENPCEAVKNNVRGTRLLSEAAERHGVDRFIMISSDKAVNPSSVMGATKRVGELLTRARPASSATSYSTVRFGNVLGSNGSVLLRFVNQIKDGGPVTVTDPAVTRYFMLISEAVELVLHAAADGEAGATYVLEMGEPVRLLDFAKTLIRLSGRDAADIPITFTGLRPGEKMYEELVGLTETSEPSGIEKIQRVTTRQETAPHTLADQVAELEQLADAGDDAGVLTQLRRIEPSYRSGSPDRAQQPEVASPSPVLVTAASGLPCPLCSSMAVYRSRTRSTSARVRKRFTNARPHRCHDCGWRGWIEESEGPESEPMLPTESRRGLDLGQLDQVVRSHSFRRRG